MAAELYRKTVFRLPRFKMLLTRCALNSVRMPMFTWMACSMRPSMLQQAVSRWRMTNIRPDR